ncbi:hypothetical protein BC567DRAFT_238239 [Phyllosticta citribraziliensis]
MYQTIEPPTASPSHLTPPPQRPPRSCDSRLCCISDVCGPFRPLQCSNCWTTPARQCRSSHHDTARNCHLPSPTLIRLMPNSGVHLGIRSPWQLPPP